MRTLLPSFALIALMVSSATASPLPRLSADIASLNRRAEETRVIPLERRSRARYRISRERVSLTVPGLGRIRISLDSERKRSWRLFETLEAGEREDPVEFSLLQGSGELLGPSGDSFPVAATLTSGESLRLFFRHRPLLSSRERMYEIEIPLRDDIERARVKSVPESVVGGKSCPSAAKLGRAARRAVENSGRAGVTVSASRVVTLATDADFEWFKRFGARSNVEIATIVNIAQAIYLNNLEIGIELARQNVWTSASQPYTSSNIDRLLTQLQSYTIENRHLGDADLYFLFSGKDFQGDVIGYAFIGVTCNAPQESFGMIQFEPGYDPYTLAHEMGHSFGMDHDDSSPRSLMSSVIEPGLTVITDTSKGEAMSHFARGGASCFDLREPVAPSDESTFVKLQKRFRAATGQLTLTAQVGGITGGSCGLSFLVAPDRSFENASVVSALESTTVTYAQRVGRVKNGLVLSAGEDREIYAAAVYQCPEGEPIVSNVVSFKPARAGRARALGSAEWVSKISGKLGKR